MRASGWTVKEGVELRAAHDLPHMVALREAAVRTSPHIIPDSRGRCLVVITEGFRPPMHTDDAHTWCLALDLRVSNILLGHGDNVQTAAWDWVARMRNHLGNDSRYQFDCHGDGPNFHIHAEFDPR